MIHIATDCGFGNGQSICVRKMTVIRSIRYLIQILERQKTLAIEMDAEGGGNDSH